MKRGKHSKRASYKPKFKKSLFFVLLSLIVVCMLLNNQDINVLERTQPVTAKEDAQDNTSEDSNKEETIVPEEEQVIPSEDENMKILIQNTMEKYNLNENNFAYFYYNKENEKFYFYNDDVFFTAASTVKVPVAMYYYDKINDGTYTKDSKILYADGTYEAGGGTTAATYSVGDSIPLSFLLKQSIVNSDNTAVNILIKNLGYSNCRQDISEYAEEDLVIPESFYSENITSASYAFDVINHLYENQDSYTDLIEDMKQSSMGIYLKKYITDYDVAHKYGSYNGYVHDYGIVFGEEPYLIGVFTKGVPDSDELIANISLDVLNYTLGKLEVEPLSDNQNENTTATETSE